MTDNPNSNQGAIINTDKNVPHGTNEIVAGRGSRADNSSGIATQTVADLELRQRYGEADKFFGGTPPQEVPIPLDKVNDIPTPNNPTKQDRIIPNTINSGDGFFNHTGAG